MAYLGVSLLMIHLHACFGVLNGTVDLGYGFDEHTLYWFGMPNFRLSDLISEQDPYMMAKKFAAAEHGGTHLDAPIHFNPDGWKVTDIPLERLIVTGVVVEKREAAAENPDTELTVEDLEAWTRTHGPLPNPVVVICDFGWAHKYPNKSEYFGIRNDNEDDIHFPGLAEDAAEWLVNSSVVVGVGVDTPSIDPGVNKQFNAHRILTAANIYLMENLALNGTKLPSTGFQLVVMPMKIINGSGAPLRILAQPIASSGIFITIENWFFSIWIMITSIFK